MTALDRRMMLRTLLGAAAAAASVGMTFAPEFAEAAPLPVGKLPEAQPETLIEQARHVVHHHHHHRHWRHGHVHHRRRVCWWHRGRRVCGWR